MIFKQKKIIYWTFIMTIILLSDLMVVGAQTPEEANNKVWPVLKHYDQDHLLRLALPIGGIGTGTISLMGNGALRHWEIVNRPAKGFHGTPVGNRAPFFAIFTEQAGHAPVSRALMGPMDLSEYESSDGTGADNHGLPRFREISFDAAYPFGQIHFADQDLPVDVTLQAFNPLIPGDADASGIPIAVLRYVLRNKTDENVKVSICGSFENFIGSDGSKFDQSWKGTFIPQGAVSNRNDFRKSDDFQGIFMSSNGIKPESEQWGTMALTTLSGPDITYRTSLERGGWGNDILEFWDDFSADGILTEKPFTGGNTPRASLASAIELEPNQKKSITFFITWHFPNRFAWSPESVGNYYTTQFKDAWDVVEKALPKLNELENKTIDFVQAFCQSDYPAEVKEAALFNLSTLRTQTCFRTADGFFFGWEGCNDNSGCCMGSCTHVWNYEQATAFTFGDLAQKMRIIEFDYSTNPKGLMSFRVGLPLSSAQASGVAAADGQLGTIMKMYREWQLSGDDELLKRLWPNVKKALEFCWIEGGWDGDIDGVMEGCQHNTMDVEYYGPNPQMQFWYLGALRAAEEMAIYLGDIEFSEICRALFNHGSAWVDENLFNGEYYEHKVMPPEDPSAIAPGLTAGMGASDYTDPAYQLARGCLVDQLVGQYMAHICGLGYLAEPENIKKTLQAILKYNYRSSMSSHFNNMRSYALGEEAALLMASYPYERPKNPFPYFNEVMTGFEYTAAIGMLYEGQEEEGLRCIRNIRNRYDGRKRSPFDEAECGHHYARAMASWAAVLAISGFQYSAVEEKMTFKPVEGNFFWSNGSAYGTISFDKKNNAYNTRLKVLNGTIDLKRIELTGHGWMDWAESKQITPDQDLELSIVRRRFPIKMGLGKLTSFSLSDFPRPPAIQDEKGDVIRQKSFSDSIAVRLNGFNERVSLHYTLDGTEPDQSSQRYESPLQITETSTLKVISYLHGKRSLRSSKAKFFKFTAVKGLELATPASAKYPGNGPSTLVDGRRGGTNFNDGRWLGFEENDLESVIDMGEGKTISQVTIGCLNDIRSWIFLPVQVEVSLSEDGKSFQQAGIINTEQIAKAIGATDLSLFGEMGPYDIKVSFDAANVRYVRVKAKNRIRCPEGHPGAGGKAWLFVDEIIIE